MVNHLRSLAILSVTALILLVGLAILLPYRNYFPPRFDRGFLILHREHFFGVYSVAFYSHIMSTPLVLFVGLLQFSTWLRRRYPKAHRAFGKLYVIAILWLSAPSGLIMAWQAYGGWISIAGFATLAVLTWLFTWIAWRQILRYDTESHARWMMRSYALVNGALVLRIVALMASDLEFEGPIAYRCAAWISWLIPWCLVEVGLVISNKLSTQA